MARSTYFHRTYAYEDTNGWGDLLTAYDGQTITYDTIGNPLSDGTWTYTWDHGRRLESMSDGTDTWQFSYNADGLRTKRESDSHTYTYRYDGDQLRIMSVDNVHMFFVYNADGPMAISYSGTTYYYTKNLQGDITGIVDSNGNSVVEYTYDAWGNILSISGSLASTLGAHNPLRYRGYVYDSGTGLYYLQSRYYNPEVGRYISADNYATTGQGFIGNNMFAYCLNNPIIYYDPLGTFALDTFLNGVGLVGIGVIACAAAATIISGGVCTPVLIAACITFAAGGITVLNGTAEIGESVTGYNYMRDGIYGGNVGYYENQKVFFQATAEMGTVALGLSAGSQVCFLAGTLVLAAEESKAIETINVGDYVWAWDEETGHIALKEVVETYVNETTELVHILVDGEKISATPSHPFYSPDKGWISAEELISGDVLVLVNGQYVTVENTEHETLEQPIAVYNFQVSDYHTYFVGQSCVLTHNLCGFNNKRVLPATKIKRYVVSMDLERGGSGLVNIHLKVGDTKYVLIGDKFFNEYGEPLFKELRDNPIIQAALEKAKDLLNKGW